MTAAATLATGDLAAPSGRAWAARAGELLAVGGLTPILLALSWIVRRYVALDSATLAVGFTAFYAAYVINDPHFTVTYLLFYRNVRARALGDVFRPVQRARYLVAGFVVPAVLATWGLGAIALRSWFFMGLLLQLMFFLVGWHYVKQGFGVMMVLAARRGVRFAPLERLAVLAHCYAGWAYAWASPFDPGRQVEEKGVVYMTIAQPPGLERLTHVIFLATCVPLVVVLARKWIRERPPIVTPLVAMLCSVWAWSIYSSFDPLVVFVVPALHSIQYLYFVGLLRRNEAREREGPPHFDVSAKVRLGTLAVSAVALGVLLFHAGPTALDDLLVSRRAMFDKPLGPTPYFAALYAFVNVHHYFMDWVIWRRDNPETRYLRA
jgi:hypothetical protein